MSILPEAVEYHLPVNSLLAMSWVTWLVMLALSIPLIRRISRQAPSGLQSFWEFVFEKIFDLADGMIGPEAGRYYPLFVGVFCYVLFGNLLGLIPGFSSPTSTLNTTVALAAVVFVYYNYQGIRQGGTDYLKHFCGPVIKWYAVPLMILFVFIEVIGHLARPVSLAVRLFGNILAKEVLLGILALLMVVFSGLPGTGLKLMLFPAPLLLRPLIVVLGTLVSVIQAGVFTILTMIYVAGAVQLHHRENAH